jgi:anti-sigma B factor antagonist
MTPFKLEADVQGPIATLRLHGELDVSTAPALRDTVVQLISEGRTAIQFDCADLGFIDSTGLGVLIGARARCMAANGSVTLTGVKPALQRLLAVTGIEGLFLTAA